MAAIHLSLEEAAVRLGISAEEFKRRLKTDPAFKILVPIRDGATLRFKASAVDELARQLGAASDPGLTLAPLPEKLDLDSDDFRIPSLLEPQSAPPAASSSPAAAPGDDIFSVSNEPATPGSKAKGDSDVRLEASSRRLGAASSEAGAIPIEQIDVDVGGPHSAIIRGASSSKLVSPSSSKIASPQAPAESGALESDSSEFELSLDVDSDDFQLSLNTQSSDEVPVGTETPASPARGASGINLRKPVDSGISLEKEEAPAAPPSDKPSDEELDFELTLDSNTAASGIKLSGLTAKPSPTADSDSEFELTLDDSSANVSMEHAVLEELGIKDQQEQVADIFETDFEVPPLDDSSASASEVVVVESDTDLNAEPLSEVVVEETGDVEIDEVAVDLADESLQVGPSASQALAGVPTRLEEQEEALVVAGEAYRPAPWGPVPAILLLLAFPFMMLGVLMGYQTVETMVGYQQPQKPISPLLRSIASTLDMELKDQ